jgi:hypothetical protein
MEQPELLQTAISAWQALQMFARNDVWSDGVSKIKFSKVALIVVSFFVTHS